VAHDGVLRGEATEREEDGEGYMGLETCHICNGGVCVARDDRTALEGLRICEVDLLDRELPNKLVSAERWRSFADARRISGSLA
jgi:hypothetical protein